MSSMDGKKSVTLADVARRAGVTAGTVSKALNGRGQLRPQTRSQVIAAAQELGFHVNMLARSLVEGRTYTVGIVTNDSFGRFTMPVMLGAEDTLDAGKISVLLCDGRGDRIREQHHVRTLLSRRVDGIIVTGRGSEWRPSIGRDLPVPVVYALVQSEDPADLSITPDDQDGGRVAVQHLLDTGRRRIAHITGPATHLAVVHRNAGALAAMATIGEGLVLGRPLTGEWSERWGREAAAILMRSGEPFDGIFCGSDQIARGVLDALREAGRQVPQQAGVIGVDNWVVMAEGARPSLSTIDLNLSQLGHAAADVLLSAFGGKPLPAGAITLPCRLVARASTEPAPPSPSGRPAAARTGSR